MMLLIKPWFASRTLIGPKKFFAENFMCNPYMQRHGLRQVITLLQSGFPLEETGVTAGSPTARRLDQDPFLMIPVST